jgi:hypothetical protein
MPRIDVSEICEELKLTKPQCQTLAELLPEVCPPCTRMKREKGERKESNWQKCIKKERAGKPFDPDAIRDLAKKYKAGQCP